MMEISLQRSPCSVTTFDKNTTWLLHCSQISSIFTRCFTIEFDLDLFSSQRMTKEIRAEVKTMRLFYKLIEIHCDDNGLIDF